MLLKGQGWNESIRRRPKVTDVLDRIMPVSYTHLDVYKRQELQIENIINSLEDFNYFMIHRIRFLHRLLHLFGWYLLSSVFVHKLL